MLKPEVFKDECKTPVDQLFYANIGGFGCKPGSCGKVMGKFLSDGEETSFHRYDFIGIIKDECLPDWAREKLNTQTADCDQTQDGGITMQ